MSVYLCWFTHFTDVADWRFPMDREMLEAYSPGVLGKWPVGNPQGSGTSFSCLEW